MPVYEDKNGQRIETDREFNEAELDEAFGVKPATPQQAGANALTLAQASYDNAAPAIKAPKAPTTGEEKANAYYDYLKKGIDLSTRPGPAQTMAAEEKKVRGEQQQVVESWQKYDIKTDDLKGAFGNEALDRGTDIAPIAVKGAIGLVESAVGIADLFSKGYAGKGLEKVGVRFKDAKQDMEYFLSPQQQKINQEIGKVQDFGERLKYGIRNPSYILQSVAESIPTMLAGGALGRMVATALPALAPYILVSKTAATAIGAGVGEGAVTAGQMAEEVRQGNESGLLTGKQVGAISLAGLVTGLIGAVGGKTAQYLGIDDIDVLLVGGAVRAAAVTDAERAAKKSVLTRVFGSMIVEGAIEEMPQSAQEKMMQNIAEGKPPMQGVAAAAADGLLSGAVMAPMSVGYHHVLDKNDRIASDLQKKIEDAVNKPAPPPGEGFTATETTATEPETQKSAPVVTTLEDGRTVATQDGVEIGSHTVGGVPILSEEIHGEERADILRQLMVNEPQAEGNVAPDASQTADATVIPQTGENASQAPEKGYQGVTLQEAQEMFPGQTVTETDKGHLVVTTPEGKPITHIDTVEGIVIDLEKANEDGYQLSVVDGKVVDQKGNPVSALGRSYVVDQQGFIELTERGKTELAHETYHIAEKTALTEKERSTVAKEIPEAEKRAIAFQDFRDADDARRAELATKPLGQIWQKILDWANQMRHKVTPTAYTTFNEIKQGRVWDRELQTLSSPVQYSIQGEKEFVVSPNGGVNFGEMPQEIETKSDGRYPNAPIRLERGVEEAYGHTHIGEERIQEIKDLGYINELHMLYDVAQSFTQVYEQPNGRLLLVKKNEKSGYAVVELQTSPDNYYGVTTWFIDEKPPRGKPYEERSKRKLLLDVARTPDTGLPVSFPTTGNEDRADDSRRIDRSNSEKTIAEGRHSVKDEQYSIKDKGSPETLESYARKKRFNFNIPGHSNKEAIENGLFNFVKNDAVGLDKAAEELQGMGLLGATPDEYATAGDYLYDELKKIVANRTKEKSTRLLSEKERGIIELREDLKRDGYNEREIETIIRQTEEGTQKDITAQPVEERNRETEEILLEDDTFVSEYDASQQTTGETGTESLTAMEGAEKDAISTGYNQAETQAATELKQSQAFEEFERAVLGNVNFGDTSMEDPLTRGMTVDELKAYHKTLAGNPQINKLENAVRSLRVAQKELTAKIRAANKEEVKGLKEQMRELKAIGNDLFKAGQRFARTDAKVTEQRMREEIDGYKKMIPQARTLANEFFKAGQRMGAFDALQKIRQSMEMLKLRTAQLKQYRKLRDFLVTVAKTIDKKKTIDPEYRKAIKAALTYGAGDLEAFVAQNFQKDDPSMIPQEQIDLLREAGENDLYERKPTFEDLDNQVSIIKQLMYQGRKLREITVANQRFEFKAAVRDMVDNIRSVWNVPALDKKGVLRAENYKDADKSKQGILRKMLDVTNSMLSVLRKGEYIIKNLVAYDSSSPFYQATFGRMIESERTHLWLSRQVEPMIQKAALLIRDEYQSGEWDSDITVTDVNGESETFTRSRLIAIALNSGCVDNINAMMQGNELTKEMIQAVNDALTPAEKQFVRAVWNIFKWQLPHLQKAYKSMTGEDMVLVKGVYYPMFFDTNLSGRIADAQANQNLMQLYGSVTSINKGRTMTRKGGLEPLTLDPMKFLSAIDQTNKFIAYGESVRDVNRILSDMTVKSAIRDAIGDQYNRRLKDWLKRIANPIDDSKGSLEGIDKVMGVLRDRAQVAILGCALSTAFMQPMAITMTVNRLGLANTLKGFLDFYSDWSSVKEFCLSSSGWLQMRVDETGDITIAEMMRKGDIFADPKSMKELYNKALFAMIKMFDSLVTIPTWYSAYQVEMEKSGNHQNAVNYADEITRNSQGSTAAKDLAEVQGGNNTRKAFTMFYSFFSQQYNELVRSVDEVKHGNIGMLDLMRSYMWVIAVPAILQAIIKSRGWLDEEKDPKKKGKRIGKDIAKEMAGNAAASIPLLGSFVNAMTSGFDFRPSAVTGLVESGQKVAKGLTSERGFWGKKNGEMPAWMREAGMTLGYIARLPSRQMMRVAEEVWKVAANPKQASWKNAYNLIYKEPNKKKK